MALSRSQFNLPLTKGLHQERTHEMRSANQNEREHPVHCATVNDIYVSKTELGQNSQLGKVSTPLA